MPREVIWMRPESAGVGRPAEHSRAEIAAVGMRIADAEGLKAVTMRRVAAELGTGAASLYRYVRTRDELVDLMVDASYADLDLARPFTGWRDGAADLIAQGLALIRRRPWVSDALLVGLAVPGPHSARLAERYLEVLADHPAAGPQKMAAIGVVSGMIFVYGQQEARAKEPDWMLAYAGYMASLAGTGEFPRLAAVMAEPPVAALSSEEAFLQLLVSAFSGVLDGPGQVQ
ncbi:TetR/AcrR family transcriptional regulator [Pseudonocardia sp. GCM10023141]|uniref:TetR/AcrR family transcriptional regulator n=1 Tax=Pseudonocardia sp. GCM10023141 TaxID=3252653 RepID=UPI00361AAC1A